MVDIPYSSLTVQDPGLGVVSPASLTPVVIGTASSGTADDCNFYNTSKALTDAHGYGDGVEAALQMLEIGGGPIGFIKIQTSVAAANGTVTQSGASPPLITLAGDAVFDAFCRLEIVAGGTLGTATFRYCIDGYNGDTASERTYSGTQIVPAGGDFLIPGLGVTVTFPAGTYDAEETYTWTSDAAGFNATDLASALDALDATVQDWRYVVLATNTKCGDATAHAALTAAMQTELQSYATNGKWRRFAMPATVDSTEDITSAYSTLTADRGLVSYGMTRVSARKTYPGKSAAIVPDVVPMMVRAAGSLISTDLKRVPGNGVNDGGPLPGILKLFNDERVDATGYSDFKVSTLRTYQGRAGQYITQGYLKSADGSDFTVWPRGLVMDVACETAHDKQVTFIGRGVRTNSDGTIDERDALRLEAEVQVALEAVLTSPRNAEGTDGHISAVRYTISRTHNVLTTGEILATVGIRPLGYIDYVETVIGYTASLGDEEATEGEA